VISPPPTWAPTPHPAAFGRCGLACVARDQAIALERYAKLAKDVENERRCCEIRLRAERKAGDLRKKEQKSKGGRPSNKNLPPSGGRVSSNKKRREDLGISKKQDEQWQALADVPEEQFEAALAQAEKPTTAGIIRATAEPKQNPVSADALWLWGRLKDFDRDGLLDDLFAGLLWRRGRGEFVKATHRQIQIGNSFRFGSPFVDADKVSGGSLAPPKFPIEPREPTAVPDLGFGIGQPAADLSCRLCPSASQARHFAEAGGRERGERCLSPDR
jgi:hypothetical protein